MESNSCALRVECPYCGSMSGFPDTPKLFRKCTKCGGLVVFPWGG